MHAVVEIPTEWYGCYGCCCCCCYTQELTLWWNHDKIPDHLFHGCHDNNKQQRSTPNRNSHHTHNQTIILVHFERIHQDGYIRIIGMDIHRVVSLTKNNTISICFSHCFCLCCCVGLVSLCRSSSSTSVVCRIHHVPFVKPISQSLLSPLTQAGRSPNSLAPVCYLVSWCLIVDVTEI